MWFLVVLKDEFFTRREMLGKALVTVNLHCDCLHFVYKAWT